MRHLKAIYFLLTPYRIQIFHPVFQEFSDRLGDSTFKPDEDVLSVTEISSSEGEAADKLNRLLSVILGRRFVKVESVGERIPNGLVYKELGQNLIPLICFEYKRTFGEGGCDPLTQAEFSLREFLVSNKVCGFRSFFASIDAVLSSNPSLKSVAAHPSSSPVVALIYPY